MADTELALIQVPTGESALCSVAECKEVAFCRGFCSPHYRRYLRHGDPTKGTTKRGDATRFLSSLPLIETDECIIWPFALTKNGYASIGMRGTTKYVHRLVCEGYRGPPEYPGQDAAHRCGRDACVNKRHLRWATRLENMADQLIHGTRRHGETHASAKLTWAQVLEIRDIGRAVPLAAIAEQFDIGKSHACMIIQGKRRIFS